MPNVRPSSVNAYLAAQPAELRILLQQVRAAIQKALPDAEEVISYGIPAYRVHNRIALHFAGWKKHYAIYPVTQPLFNALKDELQKYDLSGKGTVRFPI